MLRSFNRPEQCPRCQAYSGRLDRSQLGKPYLTEVRQKRLLHFQTTRWQSFVGQCLTRRTSTQASVSVAPSYLTQPAPAERLCFAAETYRAREFERRAVPAKILDQARALAGYPDDRALLPLHKLAARRPRERQAVIGRLGSRRTPRVNSSTASAIIKVLVPNSSMLRHSSYVRQVGSSRPG